VRAGFRVASARPFENPLSDCFNQQLIRGKLGFSAGGHAKTAPDFRHSMGFSPSLLLLLLL
jgi:hypothetical protein